VELFWASAGTYLIDEQAEALVQSGFSDISEEGEKGSVRIFMVFFLS